MSLINVKTIDELLICRWLLKVTHKIFPDYVKFIFPETSYIMYENVTILT